MWCERVDITTAEIGLKLVSLADGETNGVPVGRYLAAYEAEANDGYGMATWTADRENAMTFASGAEAAACYQAIPRNRPVRADGKPNRPLTMFMMMFD
jgi:hypothetical protein